MKTIREAAAALCDRWDTPLWKDVEHTAMLVHSLRTALAQPWPDLTKRDRESYQKGHAAGVAHHKQALQPEQKREWVDLTDEQMEALEVRYMSSGQSAHEFLEAVKNALKENNT